MLLTIIAILITVLPFLGLVYFDVRKQRMEKQIKPIRTRRIRVNIREIQARYPFVTLVEAYYLKKYKDPSYKDVKLNGKLARRLRMELYSEITRRRIS
jgi:hypothetical protein